MSNLLPKLGVGIVPKTKVGVGVVGDVLKNGEAT